MANPDIEALLGPERPPVPAEARRLERLVEEEDFALRRKLAGYAAPVLLFFLFVFSIPLGRLFHAFPALPRTALWMAINIPLLVLVCLTFRRRRVPIGRGRFIAAGHARRIVLGMLAANLFLSFGLGWIEMLWDWAAPAGW